MTGVSRRDFLRRASWALTSLAAASPLALAARHAVRSKPPAAPRKVIVIGAGLAGLSAAYELLAAGHDVTILEARTRPGGSVLTLREPFADGLYAEAGAMQVFDSHPRALKYSKLFGLELDPVPGSLAQYDRITFSGFLRARGASPAALAMLKIGLPSGLGHLAFILPRQADGDRAVAVHLGGPRLRPDPDAVLDRQRPVRRRVDRSPRDARLGADDQSAGDAGHPRIVRRGPAGAAGDGNDGARTARIDARRHGGGAPGIREHFEGGASKCWDEDDWARGAYAWFRPGQMIALMPHIAPPEGRIHFAGEHASSSPGWMEGALESGERVAREISSLNSEV